MPESWLTWLLGFGVRNFDRAREINKLRRLKDSNTTSRSDNKHQKSERQTHTHSLTHWETANKNLTTHFSHLDGEQHVQFGSCAGVCVRLYPSSFFVRAISCILLFHRHCLPCLWCRTQNVISSCFSLLGCFLSFGTVFVSINEFISLIMNDFHKNHVIDDVSRFSNGFSIYRLMIHIFFFTLNAWQTMS